MATDISPNPVGNMGGDFPKGSIGNYKGVMLCNRPNEFGQQRAAERTGNMPFNSRVDPKVPSGWNPTPKLMPKIKRIKTCQGVLMKHRLFLNQLEQHKLMEKQTEFINTEMEIQKENRMSAANQKKRDDIRQIDKEAQEMPMDMQDVKSVPLTQDNLSQMSGQQKQLKPKKGSAKPAWASTPKQQEEQKENEVDNLIEFAYDLDYEQYMEDYEVRQALAIIKDRVKEMKQDEDWKNDIAKEWNDATEAEAQDQADNQSQQSRAKSVYSYKSGVSKASYKSRVDSEIQRNRQANENWDTSTTSEMRVKMTAEEKMARKIAKEVLRDNTKLRGVHSGASIQKLLEKEARKHLQAQQEDA